MTNGAGQTYAKPLAFRRVNPVADADTLITFGRGLYIESLGGDRQFRRDFGARGQKFPLWIAACAARNPAYATMLTEDGSPIGMVVVGVDRRDPDNGHIHHLFVDTSHRGQGFGGLLDDYAREILHANGYRAARLNVAAGNARAIRFYIAQGWRDIGGSRSGGLRYMQVAL